MSRNATVNSKTSDCAQCMNNRPHAYKFIRDRSSGRSARSYEQQQKQESNCAAVGCGRCVKRGIMHPSRTARDLEMLLNGSKSTIGEIITEMVNEECDHLPEKKKKRRMSMSDEKLRSSKSGAIDLFINSSLPYNLKVTKTKIKMHDYKN